MTVTMLMEQTYEAAVRALKNESVNKMKFVFDLDGTLSFDGVTIDDEIKQVLLRQKNLAMKSPLLLHVLTGTAWAF